jgi:RNA polymerase sigma-70 factor, ECF subfamily
MESPEDTESGSITLLLEQAKCGDKGAMNQVWSDLNSELRLMARRIMSRESPSPTNQPTVLIDEAFVRLFNIKTPENSKHFISMVARAMNNYLIDEGRRRKAKKRGGDKQRCSFTVAVGELCSYESQTSSEGSAVLNALKKLREAHPDEATIADLRVLKGFTVDETAAATGFAPRTVKKKYRYARLWLRQELDKNEPDE